MRHQIFNKIFFIVLFFQTVSHYIYNPLNAWPKSSFKYYYQSNTLSCFPYFPCVCSAYTVYLYLQYLTVM